jgi:O-antigen/teichoic acid export membrane protein
VSAAAGRRGGKGRSFGQALKWSYVMDVGRQVTTLAVTFVLAGMLGPAAYGIVAIAAVYISFLQLLLAQGLQPAIIQRRDLREEHKDSAFWMIMGVAIALTLLTIPLSGWWADVNNTPDLGPVVLALSLTLPIEGLRVVQEALMRRDLNMRPLAIRTNVSVIAGGVVGVAFALTFRNVWALVAQQLATSLFDVLALWWFSRWRPRFRFRAWAARDLLSFSVGSSVASLGVFVNSRADVLITGLFFGEVAVGLYRFASRLVDTVVSVTVSSLQGASLPELSRHQDSPRRFNERMEAVLRASALLSLPILGILAGVSDPLMEAVGDEWDRAVVPLSVLCIMGAGRAMTMLLGPVLQALGRTQLFAVLSWANGGLSAVSFVVAGVLLSDSDISHQVIAMSWSRAILYGGVFLVLNLWVLKWVTKVSIKVVLRASAPSAASGAAATVVGLVTGAGLAGATHGVVRLAATGAAGAAAAGTMLLLLDPVVRSTVGRFLARIGWGGFATAAHAAGPGRSLMMEAYRG